MIEAEAWAVCDGIGIVCAERGGGGGGGRSFVCDEGTWWMVGERGRVGSCTTCGRASPAGRLMRGIADGATLERGISLSCFFNFRESMTARMSTARMGTSSMLIAGPAVVVGATGGATTAGTAATGVGILVSAATSGSEFASGSSSN